MGVVVVGVCGVCVCVLVWGAMWCRLGMRACGRVYALRVVL